MTLYGNAMEQKQRELGILSLRKEHLKNLVEMYRELVDVVPADATEEKLQDFNRGMLEQYEQELEEVLKEIGEDPELLEYLKG